ncbi:MAG: FUSC family protein [Clostridium sp.]|uniref:FUSC family protein n=1 Tax=Clostridium sp. TaxID=1506 RepID=UPI003EE78402
MFKNLDKKKIKKLVISNTITFVGITLFASIFKAIFGDSNVLIAIATFISMMMYLDRDLTTHFFKNLGVLLFMNLGMGIVVFISTHNLLIGIPLNFLMFFAIGYITCNEYRRPVYVPFVLQYIFLYNFPVPDSQEWVRLAALAVGAILIIAPQLIINRNRIHKNSIGIFEGVSQLMRAKIDLMIAGKDYSQIEAQISNLFMVLKTMIFDTRGEQFFISEEGEASLSLLAGLEKFNLSLTSNLDSLEEMTFLKEVYFENFLKLLKGKMKVVEFNKQSYDFLREFKDKLSKNKEGLQILNSLILISDALEREIKGEYSVKESLKDMQNKIKNVTQVRIDTKNVLGISYATRLSIGMTITFFIIQMIKMPIDESVWMMFTIYSLVNPIYETAKYKTKDRLIATLLGAIVTIILLTIFKSESIRMIIVLIDGYIMCYIKQYKYSIFFATICIITMAAGGADVLSFALTRIFMVLCGMVLAIVLNKFVLRCDLNKLSTRLTEKYMSLVKGMFESIKNMAENQKIDFVEVKKFFLLCAVIENQLRVNYQLTLKDFDLPCFAYNSILTSDLYVLYLNLKREIADKKFTDFSSKLVEDLANRKYEKIEDEFNVAMNEENNIRERLMYSLALNILDFSDKIENNKEII